jgi:hypothetical protein
VERYLAGCALVHGSALCCVNAYAHAGCAGGAAR